MQCCSLWAVDKMPAAVKHLVLVVQADYGDRIFSLHVEG